MNKAETEISDGTGDLDINPEATRCFYKNQKNTHWSKQASQQTLLAELAIYSGRLQLALCLSQHKKKPLNRSKTLMQYLKPKT